MENRNLSPNQHTSASSQWTSPSSQWASDVQTPIPAQPRYEDGLEVAPGTAPEWLSGHGLATADGYEMSQKIPYQPSEPQKIPVDGPFNKYDGVAGTSGGYSGVASRPWWKKKRIIGGVAGVVILAIALGVGLGVGLSAGGDDDSNESEGPEDGSKDELCKGGFCEKIMSIGVTANWSDDLYIFARHKDEDKVGFIKTDGSTWNDWRFFETTDGDQLISPPSTQVWPVNGTRWRLDLFTVGQDDHKVYNKWIDDNTESWPSWVDITDQDDIKSPLSTCFVTRIDRPHRLDVWGIEEDTDIIAKTLWRQSDDFNDNYNENDTDWETADNGNYVGESSIWLSQDVLTQSGGPFTVACSYQRDVEDSIHEIIWYTDDRSQAFHSSYSDAGNWETPTTLDGDWIGSPSLFSQGENLTDMYFFGVQDDHEMYHLSYTAGDTLGTPKRLPKGGNITSVPVFDSPEEGVFDIVALSGKGTLVHQHYDGDEWLSEWEDLEIEAASAPGIRGYKDNLWIFAVKKNGDLWVWKVEYGLGAEWREGLDGGKNLKGELSLGY